MVVGLLKRIALFIACLLGITVVFALLGVFLAPFVDILFLKNEYFDQKTREFLRDIVMLHLPLLWLGAVVYAASRTIYRRKKIEEAQQAPTAEVESSAGSSPKDNQFDGHKEHPEEGNGAEPCNPIQNASPKKKINAKEILTDMNLGMDDMSLMKKYGLSARQLVGLYRKLEESGLLAKSE